MVWFIKKGWQIFGVGVLWGRGWFLAYVEKTVLLGRPTALIKCIRISKICNCNSKQCLPKLKVYFSFWNVQVGLIYSYFTFSNWIKSCHFHNIDPFNNRNPPVSPNELNMGRIFSSCQIIYGRMIILICWLVRSGSDVWCI